MLPTLPKKMTTKDLFQELQGLLKNNGLERRRTGGSSGYVSYTKELKLMMATANSSPRNSKGAIWLRSKDNLKWLLFYVGTKDMEVKYTYYTNPRHGGSFDMPSHLFDTIDFLITFASTKALAAGIVSNLAEADKTSTEDFPKLKVCKIAVEEELKNAASARAFVKRFVTASPGGGDYPCLNRKNYSINFIRLTS